MLALPGDLDSNVASSSKQQQQQWRRWHQKRLQRWIKNEWKADYACVYAHKIGENGFPAEEKIKRPQSKTHTRVLISQHPTVHAQMNAIAPLSIKTRLNLQKNEKQMVKKMKPKALQYRVLYTIKFTMPPRHIFCAKAIEEKYNDSPCKMGEDEEETAHTSTTCNWLMWREKELFKTMVNFR